MRDYTDAAKLIKTHTWPALERMPDGRWKRSFRIALKGGLTGAATLEEASSAITQDIIEYLGTQHETRPIQLA